MNEIQFLAQFLLDESIPLEIRKQFVERIALLSHAPVYPPVYPQVITTPYIGQVCLHEYPVPWFGTVPPNCKKCGQPAIGNPFIITSNSFNVEKQ